LSSSSLVTMETAIVEALGNIRAISNENLHRLLKPDAGKNSNTTNAWISVLQSLLQRETARYERYQCLNNHQMEYETSDPGYWGVTSQKFADFLVTRSKRKSKKPSANQKRRKRRRKHSQLGGSQDSNFQSHLSQNSQSTSQNDDALDNPEAIEEKVWDELGDIAKWSSDQEEQVQKHLEQILSIGSPERVKVCLSCLKIPDKHFNTADDIGKTICPLLEAKESREENCVRLVESILLPQISGLTSAPPRSLQSVIENAIRARPRAIAYGVASKFMLHMLVGKHQPSASDLRSQLQLFSMILKAVDKQAPESIAQTIDEALEASQAQDEGQLSLDTGITSLLQLFVNLRPKNLKDSTLSILINLLCNRANSLVSQGKLATKDDLNKFSTLVFAIASKLGAQLVTCEDLGKLEQAIGNKELKGNMIAPARKQITTLANKHSQK